MEYLGIVAMVLGSSLLILWPLLKGSEPEREGASILDQDLTQLKARKGNAIQAIKELEFDLAMGKLSQEDFDRMKAWYMLDAVGYLKKMDQFQGALTKGLQDPKEAFDEEIEREISLRKTRLKSRKKRFCSQCGAHIEPGDRFCFECGAKLFSA